MHHQDNVSAAAALGRVGDNLSDTACNWTGIAEKVAPLILRDKVITCVDSHTGGEPTRLVVGGLPDIKGSTIAERSEFFKENYDYLRTTLTAEPRGRKAMHALILCPPTSPKTDFGLIITCGLGYLGMCGHGLIGAVTTVIELGIVQPVEPITRLVVETLSGEMAVEAKIASGKVEEVTFRNQPAFVLKEDLQIDLPGRGKALIDVAYGGNWFVIADAQELEIKLNIGSLTEIAALTDRILEAANAAVTVEDPLLGPATIDQIVFVGPARNPVAHSMNMTTSTVLGFDRSPCGTGSSAKMAVLHAKGLLKMNEECVHESATTGSLFRGRIVEETRIGNIRAIVPEITGSAYLTGIQYVLMDERDELVHGFVVD